MKDIILRTTVEFLLKNHIQFFLELQSRMAKTNMGKQQKQDP
jgi:hypothetical protein